MKEMKRILSIFLCLIMLVGIVPVTALAEETADDQQGIVTPTEGEDAGAAQTETEPTSAGEDETTPPEDETTAPEDETTVPGDGIIVPGEGIIVPGDGIIVPDNDLGDLEKPGDAELNATGNDNGNGMIYILAGGDFQEAGDHTASTENVNNILSAIYGAGYTAMNGFLFIGDYDCETHNDANQTASGIAALMGAVSGKYSNIDDANSILVQGNHDSMDSRIDATGGHNFEGYSVFVMNEDDYPNNGGSESQAKALAEALQTWLNAKIAAGYDDPIFITSHVPLHFGPRTNVQGDGMYAKYIFDVLNAAGQEGLNIIFLHGHNHAYGYDEYLGGHAIYLPKGDTINIAKVGSKSEYTTQTLAFTYMNAGYTGYYNESGYSTASAGTDKLSMTVFAIGSSTVTVGRYSAAGALELKAAGEKKGDYINNVNVAADTSTYSTTQTITLTTPVKYTVIDEATGVTVTSRYTEEQLGLAVTADVDVPALNDTKVYAGYKAYTATANVSGDAASSFTATITIPVPTEFPLDGTIVYMVNSDGSLTEIEAEITMVSGEKVARFNTTQPGTYAIAVKNVAVGGNLNGWTDVSSSASGYEYVLDTDGIDTGTGNKYIIVARDQAYLLDGGSAVSVTISGNTATTTTRNYEYYFTGSADGLITRDGTNTLYQQNWGIHTGYIADSNLDKFSNLGNGYYRLYDGDGTARSLYYDGSSWTVTNSDHTNSNYSVRLYKYNGELKAETAYAKLTGESGYKVPYGTSEANALAAVKAGITGIKASDTNGSNQTNIADSDLAWAWTGSYNGNVSGTYEMTVSYNGKVLGTVAVEVEEQVAPAGTIGSYVDVSQAGNSNYTYTRDTDGVNTDSGYLIVGSSNAVAMTGTSGSIGAASVTVSGNTATTATPYDWKIDSSNRIYTMVGNTTYYLKFTGSYSFGGSPSGSISLITSSNDATQWEISNSNGNYSISVDYTYGYISTKTATFYLRYNSNTFNVSTSSNTVRLYGGRQDPVETSNEYAIAEGEKLYTVSTSASAAQALEKVKAGITVSTATDVNGTGKTAVDDADVTWNWVDTYSTTPGYYTVEMIYEGKSLGTVEVQVTESGEGTLNGWVGETTGGSHTYVLDTDGIDYGANNKYLIVGYLSSNTDGAYDYALTADGSNTGIVHVDISGNTATVDSRAYEWYFATGIVNTGSNTYNTFITQNGTTWLYHTNSSMYVGNGGDAHRGYWSASHRGNGVYRFGDQDGATWYLRYSATGQKFTVKNSTDSNDVDVRLYKYTGSTGGETKYYSIEGATSYNVIAGSMTEAQILTLVQQGITGYVADDANGTNKTEIRDGALTWTWVDKIDPNTQGYYTMEISYNGKVLGSVEVFVQKKAVSYYSVEPKVGYVSQNASQGAVVKDVNGQPIMVTTHYVDGSTTTSPLTVGMLSNSGVTVNTAVVGTLSGLIVKHEKHEIESNFTLHIIEKMVENYPDYPDEGAVKVNKTATGVDFQSSGVAIVELSASGVPVKKGADVIIMLDTSSSMTSHTVTGSSKTRAAVLEEALADLIERFKTPGEDGELLDIKVAIADFNGFYGDNHSASGTPYDRDAADMMSDNISYNANSEAKVYTGNGTLSAGAFIPVENLAASYTLNYTSGTNYDYAFDAIYQLGTAIRTYNEDNDEDRDLYVIFMSDGAAMQWNYYHAQGASSLWNNWITGAWTPDQLDLNCTTHAYYYNEDVNGDGMYNDHRMATAIKGSVNDTFEVIRKTSTLGTPTGETNMYMVPGLGAKMFSISFDAQADTNVTEESMDKSIASLATPQTGTTQYYYKVTSADELKNAFVTIGNEIAYAAYNVRFVDNMGADFDLQMANRDYLVEGSDTETDTIEPVIEVLIYDIYTRADYEAGNITKDQIGDRKGTSSLKEVVKFSADGMKAYSNLIDVDGDGKYGVTVNADGTYTINDADDNILRGDGIILAMSFMYNTSPSPVLVSSGTKSVTVESEQFYWNMETITTTELALRYYVYLTGSMEGVRDAGSYPTNESAILYYDNYLGNPCYKETVSPVLAWEAANVSYAFYLVNEDGQPVNMNGEVVTFANRVIIVEPTLYREVLLNNNDTVFSLNVISTGVLPDGYALYDETAQYTVWVNSNSTGRWEIVKGDDRVASTYITGFSQTEAYSNELTTNHSDHDYTHTTVWFALKWEPQPLPDTVVIDFALPVEIHVLTNDMFGNYGKLIGITAGNSHGLNKDKPYVKVETPVETQEAVGQFGDATITTHLSADGDTHTLVRYELADSSLLKMTDSDVFTYCVQYANSNYAQNNGYYCSTVTVIPATTIYYEDEFVDLSSYTWQDGWVSNNASGWTPVTDDTYVEGADITQDEDRPGNVNFAFETVIDANNVYGYDSAYTACSKYSLGSAAMAHVDYDNYAEASFSFYGTGFDVISMTSNQTGAIIVRVTDDNGTVYRNIAVDTYYGYAQDANGEWVTSKNNPAALYQVPVIAVEGLTYGKYNVTIRAMYDKIFDHGQNDDKSYDFYLDAIRIYDPANDGAGNSQIGGVYEEDQERWPVYQELRDNVIEAAELAGSDEVPGIVFIDSKDKTALVSDYSGVGPNNELYLAPNQAIAFNLNLPANVASVHIGIKSATGSVVSYKIFDGNTVTTQDALNALPAKDVSTATAMYYDITGLKDKTIVIYNHGLSGIVSLTDIKVTFTQEPDVNESFFQASKETIDKLVKNMNTTVEQNPVKFEIAVAPTTAIVGGKVIVKVTTGNDISAVRIGDMMITGYYVSGENRIWTAKVATPDATNSVRVETYNNEGFFIASKTVEVGAVNVEEAAANILKTVVSKMKTMFGW